MAYKNEHIFLPLVQKARKKKCLDKLLAGRGEWFVVQTDMFGDFPGRPTAVNDIYIFGIYPIYKNGDASIAQETEDAIVKICQQKYDDDAYLAAHALYSHLAGSGPLFPMDKDRLQTAIRECIKRDEEKLKKCSKWVYTLHDTNGPRDLYHFLQLQNSIYLPLGVDLFEETRIEHEEPHEIAKILQGRPVDEELLVEYPGGTIVSGVIDEIRENYDYIGMDEPLYRKREDYILHVHDVIQDGREEIGPGRLLALNSREKPKRIMDSNGNVIWGAPHNKYKGNRRRKGINMLKKIVEISMRYKILMLVLLILIGAGAFYWGYSLVNQDTKADNMVVETNTEKTTTESSVETANTKAEEDLEKMARELDQHKKKVEEDKSIGTRTNGTVKVAPPKFEAPKDLKVRQADFKD